MHEIKLKLTDEEVKVQREMWNKYGFIVLRHVIDPDPELIKYLKEEYKDAPSDGQTPGCPCKKDDWKLSQLQIDLLPLMESVTGHPLYPAYNYMRLYEKGNILDKHTDRPACEISLSLCLEYSGEQWPLWITDFQGVDRKAELEPGDMLIYHGCDLPHWRDPATCDNMIQTFIHYVRKDGKYHDRIYDRLAATTAESHL